MRTHGSPPLGANSKSSHQRHQTSPLPVKIVDSSLVSSVHDATFTRVRFLRVWLLCEWEGSVGWGGRSLPSTDSSEQVISSSVGVAWWEWQSGRHKFQHPHCQIHDHKDYCTTLEREI